jgi:hypothetical protein
MDGHNCIRELRTLVSAAEQKSSELRKDLDDCKYDLAEQRRDISILKDVVRKIRGGADNILPAEARDANHQVSTIS